MSVATIQNGSNIPLNFQQGTLPNMSEALTDYFQLIEFTTIVKTTVGFQLIETPTTTQFWGIIMPLSGRQLQLLPEGQRAWNWLEIFAQPVLTLFPDDVVTWQNKQLRIMSRKDFALYSYVNYTAVSDWSGSGP